MFSIFKIAITGLKANKTRTILTTLGIVIGISAIIIVMSAGDGIRGLILGQIESFGTDIIETEVKVPSTKKGESEMSADIQSGASMATGVTINTLKLKDMKDIDELENVEMSYAGILGQEQVNYGSELRKAFLLGVSSTYIDIDKSEVDYGRFYTDNEEKSLAQVAVLGSEIKEKLFGEHNPLGKNIKIRGKNFKVIGVIKKRGAVSVMNFDDYIYIPVRTAQKKLLGVDYVLYMIHKIKDISLSNETAEDIKYILRNNHNIINPDKDDFRVTTMEEMMEMMNVVTNAITLLLLAIVSISLIVGGVGIMNTMLVTVSERTQEVGLRKAVGASNSDILKQFLIESVIITLIGATIGIILGIVVSYLIALIAKTYFNIDWHFIISWLSIIIALIFAFILGLGFGIYPAKKAAKLHPIEAMREE
ncbi:MAG: FtsX-like permease family protein [Xanthomonadaceae bacterium]|nr:FtsX-like permease family protein [Rhodospirillaceae bacterium]NIA17807.1 FtsX-like permease family protein [Xanthomonadaceae bacterium]